MSELNFPDLVALVGPRVSWLLALVAADVLGAVFLAIKDSKFDLAKLADFYRSNIIPKLGGWLVAEILVRFMLAEYVGESATWLTPALSGVAYGAVVLSLVSSVGGHLIAIGVIPAGAAGGLERLGIRSTYFKPAK